MSWKTNSSGSADSYRAFVSQNADNFSLQVISDSQAAFRHRLGDFTNMISNLIETPTTLFNCAAPMHTSKSILAYLPHIQDDIQQSGVAPDVSIVWLGGNDAVLEGTPTGRHVPVADFKANARSIIESINDRAIHNGKRTEVILITPAPLDLEGMPGVRGRLELSKIFMNASEEYDTDSETPTRPKSTRGRSSYSGIAGAWRKGGSNAHTSQYARAIMELGNEMSNEISSGGLPGISLTTINLWDSIVAALGTEGSGVPPDDIWLDGMHLHGTGFQILETLIREKGVPGLSSLGSGFRPYVVNLGAKIPNFLHTLKLSSSGIKKSYGRRQHSESQYSHVLPAIAWCLTINREENVDLPLMLNEY